MGVLYKCTEEIGKTYHQQVCFLATQWKDWVECYMGIRKKKKEAISTIKKKMKKMKNMNKKKKNQLLQHKKRMK
jgi:hypothetical protein